MTLTYDILLIIAVVMMVSAIITPLLNGFFRIPKSVRNAINDESQAKELQPVSIIITPHENAKELEANLPTFLSQDYPVEYEVIVVAWKGDSETEDILKRYKDHPRLYSTFIPETSRYMSRKKLAITLGVKAAKNEWLLITDIECTPLSDQWLKTMARNCSDGIDMVYGYTNYDEETSPYRRFERLHTDIYLFREAAKGTAYRHNSNNLMFRKSLFIGQDGFRGNLKYLRGEYDFMVNKYAQKGRVALELNHLGWLKEQEPTNKGWRNKHLFYMENRKHLKRSFWHRFIMNLDQLALHFNYILILTCALYAIITGNWLLAGVAGAALITTCVLRLIIAKRALSIFSEDISLFRIPFYEISLIWNYLSYKIKYIRADKYDFISHKL